MATPTSAPPAQASATLAPGRADLQLSQDGARSAGAFDDVYFSSVDGLAEARAVFLDGCGLPAAWADRERFVVGELGFGAGLNVLALWDAWMGARPPSGVLHIVSVEGFPLEADEARAARRTTPALAAGGDPTLRRLCDALHRAWPPRIKGVHRRWFEEERVTLTLAHLPVLDALSALELHADAWFLDGFAPAKNPDMWSADVLAAVAARTAPGGRAATFTVAGSVRRGLDAAGFRVEKKPGFGTKRERLEATLVGAPGGAARSPLYPRSSTRRPARALIVGAGVAGAAMAAAFARRGVETLVLTADDAPGVGASGAPAAIVMPRLDRDDRPEARFHRCAYAHVLWEYGARGRALFEPIGAVQIAADASASARFEALADAQALPPAMARFAPAGEHDAGDHAPGRAALVHPPAGCVRPPPLLDALLSGARLERRARVARLEHAAGAWRACDTQGRTLGEGDVCVLACGPNLAAFNETRWLPVEASRGQITIAPLAGPALTTVIAFGGYTAPLGPGRVLAGATYDRWGSEMGAIDRPDHLDDADARNLASLAEALPGLAGRLGTAEARRVALRATTPDRLPYAGGVPDAVAYRERFAGLRTGMRNLGDAPGPLLPGLFVLGGLGSRGFTLAPLLAEALASEACGEPGALERGAAEAVHPARPLVRSLKRSGR